MATLTSAKAPTEVHVASMHSGVSVLSSPHTVSGNNEHASGEPTDSNVDLLEETERLLAKMNSFSHLNSSSSQENSTDVIQEANEELNEMLAKAGHLSSMMQSISETISLGASATAQLTPSTRDDVMSHDFNKHHKVDPPGSVATQEDEKGHPVENTVSPDLIRPASHVHLPMNSMDDDVSSVGSASFRPYHPRPQSNPTRLPQKDDLLGVLPNAVDSIPELQQQLRSKIPPTDLRATFESETIQESGSRREATAGGVQWEKVTTANPGEDDYVPLVDYSTLKPKSPKRATSSGQGSRVERHRQGISARRKSRMRLLAVLIPIVAAAFGYYHYFQELEAAVEVVVEEIVLPVFFQSYDTSLLQDPQADGFSFEGEDPSAIVTFLRYSPPPKVVEEEKPKRKGWFDKVIGL